VVVRIVGSETNNNFSWKKVCTNYWSARIIRMITVVKIIYITGRESHRCNAIVSVMCVAERGDAY
jgi:hypothetical protein